MACVYQRPGDALVVIPLDDDDRYRGRGSYTNIQQHSGPLVVDEELASIQQAQRARAQANVISTPFFLFESFSFSLCCSYF